MIKRDSHIHTSFSPDVDPSVTFIDYIDKAQQIGIKELVFTDHVDFDAVHPLFHEMIDYDSYIRAFNVAKETSPISIYLGVEMGYQPHVLNDINGFLSRYPFEHIILSIHYLDNMDLYTQEFFQGKTKEEAYTIYFETCLEAIRSVDKFTVFGHLDYIPRYAPYDDYDYNTHKDIIDDILRELIVRKKGIEINTSGMVTEGRFYPKQEVIDRYIELGGTIITYGSDAHSVNQLGRFFDTIGDNFQ